MRRANLIAAVLPFALAAGYLYVVVADYPYLGPNGPGSGFLPVWLGIAMGILSVLLFEKNPEFVCGLIASMYVGNVMPVITNLAFIPLFVRALKIPYDILMPLSIIFCITGSYARNNAVWDVGVMLVFEVIGYLMKKLGYSPAALVPGPLAERTLRQSLIISDSGIPIFFERPISTVLTGAALLAVAIPVARWLLRMVRGARPMRANA